VDSEEIEACSDADLKNYMLEQGYSGVIVPGGFGGRGIEGKIKAIKYARENDAPFLGLCLGLQCAVIEFARNVCGMGSANSMEFDQDTPYPVIDLMEGQKGVCAKGGTMRLGLYVCCMDSDNGGRSYDLYKDCKNGHHYNHGGSCSDLLFIYERHRHRYEVNDIYMKQLRDNGMVFAGLNADWGLAEIIELPDKRFFIASQFHPEFLSTPLNPHPLFVGFVKACKKLRWG
jgi:CTP synthase